MLMYLVERAHIPLPPWREWIVREVLTEGCMY